MTLLGFKERVVPNVWAGWRESTGRVWETGVTPKRHSIRAVTKDGRVRFKVGDAVQLYRRSRQPDMRKIVDVDPVVTKIERIMITDTYLLVDSQPLSMPKIKALASSDGFDDVLSFFEFFVSTKEPKFTGHIIHWDWP